ncbi:MAG: aminoacyl-tRNA hydrolase [Thermomicrobiales bacterium]
MHVVIGLGNPGREYAATRHNVGFMVLSELATRTGAPCSRKRFRSEIAEGTADGEKLILAAPQTYMNLSGNAAREIVSWYHVPIENVLVVLDDMDLPFGQLRMRARGSAGGHNGLTSVIEQLGTNEIPRLRIGIGRGRSAGRGHVLSRFSPDEERALPELIARVAGGVLLWSHAGIIAAMNELNRRELPEATPAADPPL